MAAMAAKTKKATDGPSSIVQLKATLLNMEAPVWRRLDVPDRYSLGLLHHVLQIAAGMIRTCTCSTSPTPNMVLKNFAIPAGARR